MYQSIVWTGVSLHLGLSWSSILSLAADANLDPIPLHADGPICTSDVA